MMSHYNRHASSWLVGERMRRTYQVGRQYLPKDIIVDIRTSMVFILVMIKHGDRENLPLTPLWDHQKSLMVAYHVIVIC